MNGGLYEKLKSYGESDFYPFHMPGHKRNKESGALSAFYSMDITEIDGFDDLHHAHSLLKEAQERASRLYRSGETYYLINGSTAGILSAVSAVAGRAEKLIIARNCHKAVYHAAFLNRLKLYELYPERMKEYDIAGAVLAEQLEKRIREILSEKDAAGKKASELIAGVIVTSPTYDGISSDVRKLADVAHSYDIPLIVDQAHGAHFGFHPAYPENAVSQGADLVIHSVHKTLPAPTQTALIHRNGTLTDKERLRKYLRIYQSSSPSYLLMAGIDAAVDLVEREGRTRLEKLLRLREELLSRLKECRYLRICPDTEPGKLVISVKGSSMTGQMLYDLLRDQYHLQMEMAAGSYVLAILTMMDRKEGLERLAGALLEIDAKLKPRAEDENFWQEESRPEKKLDFREAYLAPYERIELAGAKGRISAEFIHLYPPGIPLLIPGEVFTESKIKTIEACQRGGYTVYGIEDNKIKAVKLPE